ncbi:MAG: hypothetical protein FWJ70_03060 [Micromonosporaceae bacterium]|jgi:MFS family permease
MTSRPRNGRPAAPDATRAGTAGAGSTGPRGADVDVSLRAIFRGRRGRLLGALLFTEFGVAVHSIAYSSVLPLASAELDGSALYGAVLTAGAFTTILVLAIGPDRFAGIGPVWTLAVGTVLFLAGVALAVTAQDMVWILVGMVLRGLAGGLLVGLGLTAIGALFEDALRPRVMGLFAVMWLLPSLAGPALNAAVAVAAGWRAAMAWPAVVVLVGRLLVGRDAAIIPWRRSTVERPDVGNAVALLLGLVLAASAPAARSGWGVPMLVAGLAAATVASLRVLRVQVSGQRSRFLTTASFFGLCLAFFGGSGIVSLAVVDGLGNGVVASNVAVGAGLLAWAVTGTRPPGLDARVGDSAVLGLVVLCAALALCSLALTPVLPSPTALPVLVAAWSLAGLGMGVTYPRISSQAMDDLAPERVPAVATAVAFAETSGTAVGSLLGGGTYSLASTHAVAPTTSIGWAYLLLTGAAAAALLVCVRRRRIPARHHAGP